MKLLYKLLGFKEDDPLNELDKIYRDESNFAENLNDDFNQDDIPVNTVANITFSLLDNGALHINCKWMDRCLAKPYGELLYKIHSGNLTTETLSILVEYSRRVPQDTGVVNEIIEQWRTIKDQEENQPLVKPSNVFAMAQFKQNLHNQQMDDEDEE